MLASEVGTIEVRPENILTSGCLGPGQMLEVDFARGRVIYNDELRARYAKEKPYRDWIAEETLTVDALDEPVATMPAEDAEVPAAVRMAKLGYHWDDVDEVVRPMAQQGKAPLASMGIDAPLACLSKKTRSFFDYFYQLFAQVTNPPIDALREAIVTDTTVYAGSDGNLLSDCAENCRVLQINNPVLTSRDLMRIEGLHMPGRQAKKVSLLYYKNASLALALDRLFVACDKAYYAGANILILSDRGVDENHIAIPSLLAVSAVQQYLVRTKKRTAISLILESAEPRDVHHFATLFGYGASAVNPYLAQDCIGELIAGGALNKDYYAAVDAYNKAILDGVMRIAGKKASELGAFFYMLDKAAEENNLTVTVSISAAKEDLPDFISKYL